MSGLGDQLPAIQALRAERDRLGQELYALRTQIVRTRAALRTSRQAAGRRTTAGAAVVAARRREIGDMEARLRELAAAERAARATLARAGDARRRLEALDRSLRALREALATLQARRDQVAAIRPPERKQLAAVQQAIDAAEAQQADVQRSRDAVAAADKELERQAAAAANQVKSLGAERARIQRSIDAGEAGIGALHDAAGSTTGDLEKELAALNKTYAATRAAWNNGNARLHEAITGIYIDPHPRGAVAQMDDATPFLLLPVRIETRFAPLPQVGAEGTPELWVRIYPDDIAVHTHESELTDREVTAAESYWRAIFDIEKDAAGDKASRKTETWTRFAELFGPSRSAWVARQTRPTNWASLTTLASSDELAFPPHDLTSTSAWSRAPRTRVLPDRFVVMLYTGDTVVAEQVGSIIPDELFVGPDPLDLTADADQAAGDDSFVTVDGQLTFGKSFDWASDFPRAVELGMAFRIPITAAQATQGFDRILVLGVMASAAPDAGRQLVEELLANHHHSPKGLTLLRQGTATNNTGDQPSGYSSNDAIGETAEVTGLDTPLFTALSNTDGRILADALGIGYDTLQFVYNSENTDHRDAAAMNCALYPGTLGYYFGALLRPALTDAARARLRDFFVENVTGRGPLSAIRIGDQPYGVLLTSDFSAWKEGDAAARGDPFRATLHTVLKHFDAIWQAIIPQLVYAGKNGASSDDVLMNVLGLQAGSATFAHRVGYTADYLTSLADFQAGGPEFDAAIEAMLKAIVVTSVLQGFGYHRPASGADDPQVLHLIYQHFTTPLDATNLVDGVPLSETERVRDYDAAAHRNYLHWLRDVASVAALSAQDFGGAPVPTALLYLQLRHALILQLHESAVDWMKRFNVDASRTVSARTFHNIRPGGDLTRWEVLRAPVRSVDATHPDRTIAVGDYLMSPSPPVPIDEAAYLGRMRDALDTLAGLSTARLERCLTEHVDACTYRLDAWQTAMFKARLDALRGTPQGGEPKRRMGTYVGAFGWVENVRPSTTSTAATDVPDKLRSPNGTPLREDGDNGGFVHAPSIDHAAAAAVLRAGYMSHATPADPDVMAVNLSSQRVRRALFILEGMRNGQSLEALLGYQFERGIHDRASADASLAVLNGLLFDIRLAYPIERVRVAAGAGGGAEETVEAYDVVNGVTLAQAAAPDWSAITGADGTVLTPARVAALDAERDRLADTLDAVEDLLLAESAYQMVRGNADRAGAVLGAIKDAQLPPELDVIRTPRSSRFTFTQRVTIHFPRLDPLDPAAAGWPAIAMTPRANLEPGVNQWLGAVLGAPEKIVFTAFQVQDDGTLVNPAVMSLADLELQPIDVAYIVAADAAGAGGPHSGASELEQRVAWRYRADHALSETANIRIQFAAPAHQADTVTTAEAMPLMRALQRVLSDSRALSARDYHTSTTMGGTPVTGTDFTGLRTRTESLQQHLDDVLAAIRLLPFSAVVGAVTVTTLGQAFDEIAAQQADLASLSFAFSAGDALVLQQELLELSTFGLADALPRVQAVTSDASKAALVAQAMDAAGVAAGRRTASGKLLADAVAAAATSTDTAVGLASDACKAILGQAFAVIPAFALDNEADVLQAHGDHAQLVAHATGTLAMPAPEDEWLSGAARVRPKLAAWEKIRLLRETLFGAALDVQAMQLPYRAQDSWLAVGLPDTDAATGEPFDVTRDTLSVVTHGDAAFAPGSLRCGVLVDAWTETIPAREQSTGIAFHYNRPNAMPPQVLLLAVPPKITGHWSWEALVGILLDTLRRAKLRAVEPYLLDQRTANPELGVLLPAIVSEFQQYDLNVSLDLRLNIRAMTPVLGGFYVNPNLSA